MVGGSDARRTARVVREGDVAKRETHFARTFVRRADDATRRDDDGAGNERDRARVASAPDAPHAARTPVDAVFVVALVVAEHLAMREVSSVERRRRARVRDDDRRRADDAPGLRRGPAEDDGDRDDDGDEDVREAPHRRHHEA